MANLWKRLFSPSDEISRYSLSEYIRKRVDALENNPFAFSYDTPTASYRGRKVEKVEDSYASLASYAYRGDSVVAACMRVRRDLFRQAKFCWREVDEAGPGKIFRTDELALLDKPWPNGTTGELLGRMITDVDLCGNSFIHHDGDRLRWLRPDWVSIVLSGDPDEEPDIDVLGYVYTPGGKEPERNGHPYQPDEICHWAPDQDPLAFYRGMSWVSKALEEVQGDRAATTHKMAFFRNGATLGPIVRVPAGTTMTQFKEFMAAAEEAHAGAGNAYKTMYLGGGAEVTLAAADFRQLDLKSVQGGMETRIAAVAGVHPVLVGLSEGLAGSSLNSGNFAAARRATAEMTLYSLWQDACGALQAFFEVPDKAELWIRERDIPFLREEARDRAEIFKTQILAVEAGMRAGFKHGPMVQATLEERLDLLIPEDAHSGLFSVQMQAPGAKDTNGDGKADSGGAGAAPAEPIDFGALRADLWVFADDQIERAVEEAFADLDDEEELDRARYDVRVPKGFEGGGRFRKLSDRLVALLNDWAKGEGDDDPLDEYSRDQLRRVAKELADKAREAGDEDRAARLTPRRGASSDEIKLALYKDVRAHVRGERDRKAEPGRAKFTLQGDAHKGQDVAVYRPGDKPALYRESDAGKRGALVAKFDSLDEMAAWADEHGEPRLAEWARGEAGGKGPTPAKSTPRKATPKADAKDRLLSAIDGIIADSSADPRWNQRAMGVDSPAEVFGRIRQQVADGSITPKEGERRVSSLAVRFGVRDDDVIGISIGQRLGEMRKPGAVAEATPKADLPNASDPEALRDALDLRTVPELKDMLREWNKDLPASQKFPLSGRKRDLVDRIVDHEFGFKDKPEPPRRAIARDLDRLADLLNQGFDEKDRRIAPRMSELANGLRDGSISDAEARDILAGLADEYPRQVTGDNLRNWSQHFDRLVDAPSGKALDVVPAVPAKKAAPTPYELAPSLSGRLARTRHDQREQALTILGEAGADGRGPFMGSTAEAVDALKGMGYAEWDGQRWHITDKGRAYLDARGLAPAAADTPALSLYTPAEAKKLNADLDMTVPESRDVVNAEARRRVETVLDDVDEMLAGDASDRALLSRLDGRRKLGAPASVVDELEAAVNSGDRDRLRQVSADIRDRLGAAAPTFDPSNLDGLTIRQKRARMKAMGFSQAYIDEIAPTAAMAKKAAAKAPSGPRPSGLPTDRKPESGDFDDLADRITMLRPKTKETVHEILTDLNASELGRLARKFPGTAASSSLLGSNKDQGLRIPAGLTTEEKRAWLAEKLTTERFFWRSTDMDPDDISRAEDDEQDESDDEPVDEMDLALEHYTEDDVERAAGHDVTPGHDELHHYWTRGEGLAKWVGSPKPWTTLVAHLTKYVGPEKAKVFASRWFIEVFGFAAGSDMNRVTHGKPPRGHVVGPG